MPGVVVMRPPDARSKERTGGLPVKNGVPTGVVRTTPIVVIGQFAALIVTVEPAFYRGRIANKRPGDSSVTSTGPSRPDRPTVSLSSVSL